MSLNNNEQKKIVYICFYLWNIYDMDIYSPDLHTEFVIRAKKFRSGYDGPTQISYDDIGLSIKK